MEQPDTLTPQEGEIITIGDFAALTETSPDELLLRLATLGTMIFTFDGQPALMLDDAQTIASRSPKLLRREAPMDLTNWRVRMISALLYP